jgi:outer membrane protein OmpA-like peptidoglycan-associated protein
MGRGARLALALAVGALAGACAAPGPPAAPPAALWELYVLLPEPGGRSGALGVTHEGKETVLARPWDAARIAERGRLETIALSERQVQEVFGPALAAQPPRPASFTLYFLEGRDDLTPASSQELDRVFAEIARRPAPEVAVVGHTDRVGAVAFNDALSLKRAERVRELLVQRGLAAERVAVAGRGEREPLVATPDEAPEPRNRRVEITVR